MTIVQGVVFVGMTLQGSPFDSEDKIVIGFVEVNHTEAVDFIVTRFFEDHDVDDVAPSL